MQQKPFKPIKTERLSLKPWMPSFKMANYLFDLIKNNREHFKYLPMASVKRPEEEYDFLKMSQQKWKTGQSASYAIYLRGTNTLVGSCGLYGISQEHRRGEIGYWMDSQYCGHGYMTEAVAAIIDEFFARGLNRVTIRANIKNKASCAVAKRLGFTREGVCHQELFNKYMNEYEDVVYFGKWKNQK